MVFAAAQIHETRVALSTLGDCDYDGNQSTYVVRRSLHMVTSRIDLAPLRDVLAQELSSLKCDPC